MSDNESNSQEYFADIRKRILNWWDEHRKEAQEVATLIVEHGATDTYLDELVFCPEGIMVRVLALGHIESQSTEFEMILRQLRSTFECKVDLWCCETAKHLGDEV
jgi:broad specificity phosphatase PhoE